MPRETSPADGFEAALEKCFPAHEEAQCQGNMPA